VITLLQSLLLKSHSHLSGNVCPVKIGLIVASAFIDPGELLTPKSDLWKSSKVDVRKPSWNNPNSSYNRKVSPPAAEYSHLPTSARAAFNSQNHNTFRGETSTAGPARHNATPIIIPTNPPRPFPHKSSSAFINPDMISRPIVSDLPLSNKKPEEALKDFFESALGPEKDDENSEKVELDENAGVVEGLHVKLMKHQIEGLEFLLDHESMEDTKVKGKGKYGGILADDVPPLLIILTVDGSWKDYPNSSFDPRPS
jgi:SNF2 family DNA or RNA helicase